MSGVFRAIRSFTWSVALLTTVTAKLTQRSQEVMPRV